MNQRDERSVRRVTAVPGVVGKRALRCLVLVCLAAASAWVFGAGCAGTLRFGPEGELKDPAEILSRLDARMASVKNLQAEARVKVTSPEQSGTVDAFLSASLPETLRLGILDFFGRPMADLLALPDHFQVYDANAQAVYLGEPTAENMARLLLVPISPKDAVHLFFGTFPRRADARLSLELDAKKGAYRVTLTSHDGLETETLWVETETLRLVEAALRRPDGGMNVLFDDFQHVQDVDLPFYAEMTATDASGKALPMGIAVTMRDVRLNGRILKRVFEPILPNGARVVDLGSSAPVHLSLPLKSEKTGDAAVPSSVPSP